MMSEHAVLVVEDDDVQRRQIARALVANNFEVLQASGGEEAVRILGSQRIHLVLTDRKMPGMDGLALFDYVRANHSRIPVAIVTAYPEGMEGFKPDAFLEKPFRMDQLIALVQSLTNNQD